MSDYQKKIRRGHARKKKRIIGTGGYRKLKHGAKRPSYKRSKSAPPGFGVFEEDNSDKVITFDFDETLAIWEYEKHNKKNKNYPNIKICDIMLKLFNKGFDIHIVTSRHKSRAYDVENFIERYDLPVKDVHYAAGRKAKILKDLNSKVHFDDNNKEFEVYRRLYPDDNMVFYHVIFDIDPENYYNGGLPSKTFVRRIEIKNEVI
jgi:hypothetical protein